MAICPGTSSELLLRSFERDAIGDPAGYALNTMPTYWAMS